MSELADQAKSFVRTVWWLVLLRGILAVLFGILVLAWPGATALAIVVLFGIFSIVDGITSLVIAFREREKKGKALLIVQALVSIAAGIVALVWPTITAVVLLYVIAFWAILLGILEIVASFELKGLGLKRWWWHTLSGALGVVLGIILIAAHPAQGILALLVALGVLAIVNGVSLIIAAIAARGDVKELQHLIDARVGD